MDNIELKHVSHAGMDTAQHFEWDFSEQAFIWKNRSPIGINFYPIATELRKWLLRNGHFRVFSEGDKSELQAYSNPYTYHATVIAAILAKAINSAHAFSIDESDMDEMYADIERIRIYSEQVLYTARLCEVSIKQLLHCTKIPKRLYKNSALGSLISKDCQSCKKNNLERHKISLLGSLAHRYRLCIPFEECLFNNLRRINRQRADESAHSEVKNLKISSSRESRELLGQDSLRSAKELIHVLEHLSDLEIKIMDELAVQVLRT